MPRRPKPPGRGTVPPRETLLLAYRFVALVLVGAIIGWLLRSGPPRTVPPTPITNPGAPLGGVTVILDPGHGGSDSGYRRKDCREDTLNYRFAATLGRVLSEGGANVRFTVTSAALDIRPIEGRPEPPLLRPRDARLAFNRTPVTGSVDALHQRAAFAREPYRSLTPEKRALAKGLYFLAIHHDSFRLKRVRGAHVLYDRRAGGPPRLAHVLARRLSQAGLARTKYDGKIPVSDARQLGVLNPLFNPVPQRALLEVATLSNAKDRENAFSRQWRWKFARLIRDAIIECER
ncbi:MAG: N-acetylmuramoyl-L-alanine amidase [Capsulimonadales bacterium]|nr:N-acetylmuramoyl-L-alanine amidase [Capsulimonadales bacterium]